MGEVMRQDTTPRPTEFQLGLLYGLDRGQAFASVADLVRERRDVEASLKADVEDSRIVNEQWTRGYLRGLAYVVAERDV